MLARVVRTVKAAALGVEFISLVTVKCAYIGAVHIHKSLDTANTLYTSAVLYWKHTEIVGQIDLKVIKQYRLR